MGKKKRDFVIDFVSGPIKFTAEEGIFYSKLFHIVDYDGDGYIGGNEGAEFIRRALLENDVNREIWRLASGGKSLNKLSKDSWFIAMKLVGLAQNGRCKIQPLLDGESIPLADFKLEGKPDSDFNTGAVTTTAATAVLKSSKPDLNPIHRPFYRVTIHSPVVIGSGYTRYTQYTITYHMMIDPQQSLPRRTGNVHRRFSDFEWLHQRLVQRFRGTILPPLPEKRWTGNLDATFIEVRRQALEHFINECCEHEKLSKTLELQVVLTGSPEGLSAAKDILPIDHTTSSYLPTTSGVSKSISSAWESVKQVQSSTIPKVEIATDLEYNEIGNHLVEYEKYIHQVVQTSEYVYSSRRARGYDLARFGSYLSDLSLHEKHQPWNDDTRSAYCLALVQAGLAFENVSNAHQDEMDAMLEQYITPIRYQEGKVDSIKKVMHNRQLAIAEVQRANASLQRNKERLAAARASSGAGATARIAEQKMHTAETQMQDAKGQVAFIAHSLKLESKLFTRDKAAEIRKALLAFARLELGFRQQAKTQWTDLIAELDLDPKLVQASQRRVQQRVTFRRPSEVTEAGTTSELLGLLPLHGGSINTEYNM